MIRALFVSLVCIGTAGCGASPLLHHRSAPPKNSQLEPDAAADCPLALPKNQLCAGLTWISLPAGRIGGVMQMNLWKAGDSAKGPYIDPPAPLTADLNLFMPEHGHDSSPITVTRSRAGEYLARDIFFIMPGHWNFQVRLNDGTEVVEKAEKPYDTP